MKTSQKSSTGSRTLSHNKKDAKATLSYIRQNYLSRTNVVNALLGFAARNFGTQVFSSGDLRTAIGYSKLDKFGSGVKNMTQALAETCAMISYQPFIEKVGLVNFGGQQSCTYRMTKLGYEAFMSGDSVKKEETSTEDVVLEPIQEVEGVSIDDLVNLVKKLYAKNGEYEEVINELYTINQEKDEQITKLQIEMASTNRSKANTFKVDEELKTIFRLA